MKRSNLLEKYQDIICYLFFGGCTTIVNVVVYWVLAHPLECGTLPSTIAAWAVAVTFAYLTNRKWVFHSQSKDIGGILKEIISFFLCRIVTGIIDWSSMWIFVDLIGIHDVVMKFLANMIVIILNFLASKCIIFRQKQL